MRGKILINGACYRLMRSRNEHRKKKNIFIQLGAVAACLLTAVVGILATGKEFFPGSTVN